MKTLRELSPGVVLTLLSAAQLVPMTIWATNMAEIGLPDGLILWMFVVTIFGLLLWLTLVRIGADRAGSTYVVFWGILGASTLGVRADNTPGGSLTLLVGIVLCCAGIYRIREMRIFGWLTSWAAVFVAITPMGLWVSAALSTDAFTIPASPVAVEDLDFQEHPDVVLVVFDAHTSLDVLEKSFSVDVQAEYEQWFAEGAQVVPGMRANYPLTHLSLASALEMTYPLVGGDRVVESEWRALLGAISGDNALVSAFKEQGYEYTVVESGWPGVHCSRSADLCIRGIWPDEPTLLAMERFVFGTSAVSKLRDPGPHGVIHSVDWMNTELEGFLSNDTRDLILVHLMLPHPPLRLDEECSYTHQEGLGGTTVAAPYFSDEEIDKRVDAYIEATKCARDVITHLLSILGDEAVLVAFGDHGSDSRAQLHLLPADWSSSEIKERFGILFVTNSACAADDLDSLVNLGPWLLGCLSHQPLRQQEDRFFIAVGSRRSFEAEPEPILEVTGDG